MTEPETNGKAEPGNTEEQPADGAALSPGAQSGSEEPAQSTEAPGSEPSADARPTQVQGDPVTGWCPRCKTHTVSRGFCSSCGAATRVRPARKLITGFSVVDTILGFLYFWGVIAVMIYVPQELFEWIGLGSYLLGLAIFLAIPFTAVRLGQPRSGYYAFVKGLGFGAILAAVIVLGAFLTCIGQIIHFSYIESRR